MCLLKGRLSTSGLHVHSSFTHPLEVRSVTFSPNSSLFRYVPIKEKPVVIGASQETLVSEWVSVMELYPIIIIIIIIIQGRYL